MAIVAWPYSGLRFYTVKDNKRYLLKERPQALKFMLSWHTFDLRIAGNAMIAGKLNKAVSILTQRSLVTRLGDPCFTSNPCDIWKPALKLLLL